MLESTVLGREICQVNLGSWKHTLDDYWCSWWHFSLWVKRNQWCERALRAQRGRRNASVKSLLMQNEPMSKKIIMGHSQTSVSPADFIHFAGNNWSTKVSNYKCLLKFLPACFPCQDLSTNSRSMPCLACKRFIIHTSLIADSSSKITTPMAYFFLALLYSHCIEAASTLTNLKAGGTVIHLQFLHILYPLWNFKL